MPESTMPRYLGPIEARELADELECAIADVRDRFRKKHDAELRGLEHEIALALGRSCVRYGFDLLPDMAGRAIDRLEVCVAELESKLEAARGDGRIALDISRRELVRRATEQEAKASAELAGAKASAPPAWFAGALEKAQLTDLAHARAREVLASAEVIGAGTLASLAATELANMIDDRTMIEFYEAARVYFETIGLEVRRVEVARAHRNVVFYVGSGK